MNANKKYSIAIMTFIAWMMLFFQNMTSYSASANAATESPERSPASESTSSCSD